MKIKSSPFMIVLMIISMNAFSQANIYTLQFDSIAGSPAASIDQVSWIQGHWRGEAFGGITEEIWSPPLAGSMMFSFKLIDGDQVEFYELGTISEEKNSLVLRIKHFSPDLVGWEDKDKMSKARLVKIEPDKVYFEGFTFEKVNNNEINIYVLIHSDGKESEAQFNYHRFQP